MFIDVLSFEYCAILRTFECQGSLLYTVADTVVGYFLFKSVLMTFKNLADMYLRNVYNFSYEQNAVVWLRVVLYPLLFDQNLHFFLLNKPMEEICSFTSLAWISVQKLCNINPTKVFR